jgi:hypothetical protein
LQRKRFKEEELRFSKEKFKGYASLNNSFATLEKIAKIIINRVTPDRKKYAAKRFARNGGSTPFLFIL